MTKVDNEYRTMMTLDLFEEYKTIETYANNYRLSQGLEPIENTSRTKAEVLQMIEEAVLGDLPFNPDTLEEWNKGHAPEDCYKEE